MDAPVTLLQGIPQDCLTGRAEQGFSAQFWEREGPTQSLGALIPQLWLP